MKLKHSIEVPRKCIQLLRNLKNEETTQMLIAFINDIADAYFPSYYEWAIQELGSIGSDAARENLFKLIKHRTNSIFIEDVAAALLSIEFQKIVKHESQIADWIIEIAEANSSKAFRQAASATYITLKHEHSDKDKDKECFIFDKILKKNQNAEKIITLFVLVSIEKLDKASKMEVIKLFIKELKSLKSTDLRTFVNTLHTANSTEQTAKLLLEKVLQILANHKISLPIDVINGLSQDSESELNRESGVKALGIIQRSD